MSDLFGNPEDRFSRVAAHLKLNFKGSDVFCFSLFFNPEHTSMIYFISGSRKWFPVKLPALVLIGKHRFLLRKSSSINNVQCFSEVLHFTMNLLLTMFCYLLYCSS